MNKPAALNPVWETEARPGQRSETRAAILTAAAEAFMTRGFAAATLDHVAEMLGATRGQIYHYYRSKSDLYFDVAVGANYMLDQATTTPEIAAVEGPRAQLHAIALAHSQTILGNFAFMRVALEATQHQMFSVTTGRQERTAQRIQTFMANYEERILSLVQRGIEDGVFVAPSAVIATKSVIGSLTWLTVWYDPSKATNDAARDKIAQETADFVIGGLTPPKAQVG